MKSDSVSAAHFNSSENMDCFNKLPVTMIRIKNVLILVMLAVVLQHYLVNIEGCMETQQPKECPTPGPTDYSCSKRIKLLKFRD